ncbi:MAG: hypothetical protein OXM55_06190 [Bdellovibrionales bacterium]|nr:hypothetical protein [Bdellovibrionales bacterium]
MSILQGRKLNPIEKEAERRVYIENLAKGVDTKTGTLRFFGLIGGYSLVCFFIQKYINIDVTSSIHLFFLLLLSGLLFGSILILYRWHKFKIRKKHHYLEILKKGSHIDQVSPPGANSIPERYEKKCLEQINKSVLTEIEEEYTKWVWVIYIPIVLLLIVWGLSKQQYVNIEEPYMKDIVLSILSVSFFGWFMSIITNARKGIASIRARRSHTTWIRKKNQPILFYIVLAFKCGSISLCFVYIISSFSFFN